MILRPKPELADFERVLREVPEEKRKVIVLVGRHPNEGSMNIAMRKQIAISEQMAISLASRNHEVWEKHGAVVVQIPASWTPHGFWRAVIKNKLTRKEVNARSEDIPDDQRILEFLLKEGFHVPVINLHGTNRAETNVENTQFGFQKFHVSMIHDHPLISTTWSINEKGRHIPPNELEAEFYYGNPKKPNLTRFHNQRYSNITNVANMQLVADYLAHFPPTRRNLAEFDRIHSQTFLEVLKHLASTGLKNGFEEDQPKAPIVYHPKSGLFPIYPPKKPKY